MVENHLNVSQTNPCKLYPITKQKDNVNIFVVKVEVLRAISLQIMLKNTKKCSLKDIYMLYLLLLKIINDSFKPKRINVMHPEFMFDEFSAENFKDSLIIADDVDVFPTKIKKKVLTIINSILQIGRHFNVSVCFTTHNPTNGADTKVSLAKAHIITVFQKQRAIEL